MKRVYSLIILLCLGGSILAQESQRDNCGDRAYLGIYTQELSRSKAALLNIDHPGGARITKVLSGGAADLAGLKPFDYIYGIDEHRTSREDNLTDLLQQYQAGDQATIHLVRKGQAMTVDLVFGSKVNTTSSEKADRKKAFLGITPKETNKDEIGVMVNVIDASTAQEIGLQDGDKITAINGYTIIDWSDITLALSTVEAGSPIQVQYERTGQKKTAEGAVKSRQDTYAARDNDYSYAYDNNREYAFLGIYSNTISREKARKLGFENPYGSYVTGILLNTAAERAGIQPFDYIYGVDEYRTGEDQSLTSILRRYQPGDKATLHLLRKSRDRQVPVTFGRREEARRPQIDKCDEPFLGVQSTYSYHDGTGVPVSVLRNSTAASLGMQDDDVIVSINGYPMIDWEDIGAAIDNSSVGQSLTVKWKRNGREMQDTKAVKSYCATKTEHYKPSAPRDDEPAYAPDWGSRYPDRTKVDVNKMKVQISEISRAEASELQRRHQLELPVSNSLPVEGIRLTPNSRQDQLVLSFVLPDRGSTLVRIYNNSGRNVYEYDLGNFSGKFSDEVNIAQNGTGSYYLLIKQGSRMHSKKITLMAS